MSKINIVDEKSAEQKELEKILKKFFSPNNSLGISTKSPWDIYSIGVTRTPSQMLAEAIKVFSSCPLTDFYIKSFLYDPANKPVLNLIPKDQKNIISPLEYQYCKQRDQEASDIFTNLLLFWGLLQDWLNNAKSEIIKFKHLHSKLMKLTSTLKCQLETPFYIKKIENLFREKYFGRLSDLIILQEKLKEGLLSGFFEEKYSNLTQETQDKDFELLKILQNQEKLEEFIKKVKVFMSKKNDPDEKVLESQSNSMNKIEIAAKYFSEINSLIDYIKKNDFDAIEWVDVDKTHQKVLKLATDFFYQKNFSDVFSQLHQETYEKLFSIKTVLKLINSRIIHNRVRGILPESNGLDEKNKLDNSLNSTPPSKSNDVFVLDMYKKNCQIYNSLLSALNHLLPDLEEIVETGGIFKELDYLDNLTNPLTDESITVQGKNDFNQFNRGFSLISTLMKFLLYNTDLSRFRQKVEEQDDKSIQVVMQQLISAQKDEKKFEESVQNDAQLLKISQKNDQKSIQAALTDQMVNKKNRSRLALQNKAKELAESYLRNNKQGLIDFLIEQKMISRDAFTLISLNKSSFIGNFSQNLMIMDISVKYFCDQYNDICENFARKIKKNDVSVAIKSNYEDADFFNLILYPTIEEESLFWTQIKERFNNKKLFKLVPENFATQTFSHNKFRDQYTIDFLLEMFNKAKKDGYYNSILFQSLTLLKAEREHGLLLARILKETQHQEYKTKTDNPKKLTESLKLIMESYGKYQAILEYYKESLEQYEKAHCREGYDIYLFTVDESVNNLTEIVADITKNKVPALIKRANQLLFYGCREGTNWELTKLNWSEEQLVFPSKKNSDVIKYKLYTGEMLGDKRIYATIHKYKAHVHSLDLNNLIKILEKKFSTIKEFKQSLLRSSNSDWKACYTKWDENYEIEKLKIDKQIKEELESISKMSGIAKDVVNANSVSNNDAKQLPWKKPDYEALNKDSSFNSPFKFTVEISTDESYNEQNKLKIPDLEADQLIPVPPSMKSSSATSQTPRETQSQDQDLIIQIESQVSLADAPPMETPLMNPPPLIPILPILTMFNTSSKQAQEFGNNQTDQHSSSILSPQDQEKIVSRRPYISDESDSDEETEYNTSSSSSSSSSSSFS